MAWLTIARSSRSIPLAAGFFRGRTKLLMSQMVFTPSESSEITKRADAGKESCGEAIWAKFLLDGVRILLIEDVPDARMLIARILTRTGAWLLNADSAQEARYILDSVRPDVIVSDIAMPDEDGLSFIRRFRASERLQNQRRKIPAIALTAFDDDEMKDRAISAGFQVHVGKQSSTTLLLEAITDVLRSSNSTLH